MFDTALPLPQGILSVSRTPIGNNIRRLRFEHGEMSQATLAEKTGVTRQTLIAIEAAKYSPSLELAFRIAREFDKPLEDVFFWAE